MSQTWSIISGIADDERKEQAVKAMLKNLESDTGLMLLYPAFSKPDKYVGYITRYAPGLRENGGVYTHAATWGVMALAMMGKARDAIRIFNKLNPILQAKKMPIAIGLSLMCCPVIAMVKIRIITGEQAGPGTLVLPHGCLSLPMNILSA